MKIKLSALIFALFASFIAPSSAQSSVELEAQIQALLAQIAALNGGGSTVVSPGSCNFTQTLTLGSTGAEVVELQSFLEKEGLLVLPAGESKGYFGGLTQSALASYQAMVGISPAVGHFGPVTRAYVNGQCSATQEVEICGNGIDDDGDGLIDGADPDCFTTDSGGVVDYSLIPSSYPAAIAYAIREAYYVQFTVSSIAFIGGDVVSSEKIFSDGPINISDDIFEAILDEELDLVFTDPHQEFTVLVEVRNQDDHTLMSGEVSGYLELTSPGNWNFPDVMEEISLSLAQTLPFDTGDDVEKAGIVYKNQSGVAYRQESLDYSGDYIFIPTWSLGVNADVLIFEYDGVDFYSSEVRIFSLQTGLEKEVFDIELEFKYASIQNLVHAWSSDQIARVDLFYLNLLIEMRQEVDVIIVDNDQDGWRLPAEKLIVENLETGVKTIHALAPNERNIIELPFVALYRFWFESKNSVGGKG